jgi:hypothetical protein
MVKNRSVRVWWFVVLFAAAALPRLPVVPAGFTIDDPLMVEHAEASGGPAQVLIESWPPGLYRPLVALHFEVCRVLFGGWAPGYHMVSIALHVVVTWLVCLLCVRLSASGWPALCAGLGFALLPGSNEAIAWAASVGDLWAAALLVASVLLAFSATESRPRVEGWLWAASLAAMVMGMMAKEPAMVAAVLVPLAAWLFGRRRPTWGWTVAYPAVAIAYASFYSTRVAGPGMGAHLAGNPWQCLSSTVQKLMMALVPFGQNTVGDLLWSSQGVGQAVTIVGVAGLGVLLALAVHRRDRVAVFGWLWAVAAFLPVCRMSWGERYAYLPAVGLALVAVAFLSRRRGRHAPAVTTATVLVLVVFALGSVLSAVRWTLRVGRFAAPAQNRSSIAAQWKPAPKAVSSTKSPALTRPC